MAALARGEPLMRVFDRLSTPPERTVAFTIAVIALGAKMAKADGRVTRDEIAAFREIFHIPPEEEAHAARLYNIARTEVAGFEYYAGKIAKMFVDRPDMLRDLLEGLVYIAAADREYHPGEAEFLRRVVEIFGVPEGTFRSIRARHLPGESDPYLILGADPAMDDQTLRQAYRALVRELHPDHLVGRGVPEEARRFAERRLAAINEAYEIIRTERNREVV